MSKPGFNLFSKDQDAQLGKEAVAEVEKQMDVVTDREFNAYVSANREEACGATASRQVRIHLQGGQ